MRVRTGGHGAMQLVLVGVLVVVSGCGRVPQGPAAQAPAVAEVIDLGVVQGVVWARTEHQAYRSADKGGHWSISSIRVPAGGRIDSSVYLSGQQSVMTIVGSDGTISVVRTDDAGASWSQTAIHLTGEEAGRTSLTFISDTVGWLSLELQSGSGVLGGSQLFKTSDGGHTWLPLQTPDRPSSPVAHIRFFSDTEGWGLSRARNRLFRSSDGGSSWNEVTLPRSGSLSGALMRLELPSFIGTSTGSRGVLPAFFDSQPNRTVVFYSTDADGQLWQANPPVVDQEFNSYGIMPTSVLSPDSWAVASGPSVYLTPDRGASWSHRVAPGAVEARALAMSSLRELWIAYAGGTCADKGINCTSAVGLLYSQDGGTTWSHAEPPL